MSSHREVRSASGLFAAENFLLWEKITEERGEGGLENLWLKVFGLRKIATYTIKLRVKILRGWKAIRGCGNLNAANL